LIDAVPGLQLAMVVTGDPDRSAAARGRYPDTEVVPTPDAVWARAGELDVVVIATPNRTHVPLAGAALRAGLHVVVDKPMAVTVASGLQLLDAARAASRLVTVYHNRRWDADFLTLRRLLAEGALGDVLRFESRFERWRPEPKPGWRESPEPGDAGGLLFDLGTHLIDQALVLLGPARHVYAELDVRRPAAAMDDDTFVAIRHESGTRSHLWLSAVAALPGPRMRVLGTRAAWEKHGLDPQEAALRDGGRPGGSGLGRRARVRPGPAGSGTTPNLSCPSLVTIRRSTGPWPAPYVTGTRRRWMPGTPWRCCG